MIITYDLPSGNLQLSQLEANHFSVTSPKVILLKKINDEQVVLDRDVNAEVIEEFVKVNNIPPPTLLISTFSQKTAVRLFGSKNESLYVNFLIVNVFANVH